MWIVSGLSPAGVCALTVTHYCSNAQLVVTTAFPTLEAAEDYAKRQAVQVWKTVYALNVRTGETVDIKKRAEAQETR